MDLEMTTDVELNTALTITVERLTAAAGMLQLAAERLTERENTLDHIVATIGTQRETELEEKLAAAEARITELRASAPVAATHSGRKTLPTATVNLLAKQGLAGDAIPSMEAGALDAALSSLSLEQRIAVKAQLMRSGLLG